MWEGAARFARAGLRGSSGLDAPMDHLCAGVSRRVFSSLAPALWAGASAALPRLSSSSPLLSVIIVVFQQQPAVKPFFHLSLLRLLLSVMVMTSFYHFFLQREHRSVLQ